MLRSGPALALAAVLAGSGLAGCDTVFRISDVKPTDAGVDADIPMVTGSLGWQVVDTDGSGAAQPAQLQLYAGDPHVVLDTGREVAVTTHADDSFAFPLDHAGQSYRLGYDNQFASVPLELDDSAATVGLIGPLFGRIARAPVTMPTTLTITTSVSGGTPLIYLDSTGLRTVSPRATGAIDKFTQDWSTAGSVSGTVGLLDAAKGDRLWALSLPDSTITGAYIVNAAGSAQVTIADGVALGVSIIMGPVPGAKCATLVASRRAELTRITQQVKGVTAGTDEASQFEIMSTPFPATTPTGGLPIVFADTVAPAAATPETHQITYGNPFPGEGEVSLIAAYMGHVFTLPGTTGVVEYNGTAIYAPLPTALPCPSTTTVSLAAGQVAIPSTPTLNGMALDVDNQPIDVPRDRRVPLTFPPGPDGKVDAYQVVLYEVFGNAANTTQFRELKVFLSSAPEIDLDPAELIVGKSYVFTVSARVGVPNAAHGDYAVAAYPWGNAIVYSAIVHVAS